jgi:hypothetical protein
MPYLDDVRSELFFLPAERETFFGAVTGIGERGEKSVETYNLNRSELVEQRRRAQERIVRDLEYFLVKDRTRLKEIWKQMHDGKSEYSSAVLSQAKQWWKDLSGCIPSAS